MFKFDEAMFQRRQGFNDYVGDKVGHFLDKVGVVKAFLAA